MKRYVILIGLIFLVACSQGNSKSVESNVPVTEDVVAEQEKSDTNYPTITSGKSFQTLWGRGNVVITFKEIAIIPLADGTYNLVVELLIKNNSEDAFFIMQSGWKLTDMDNVEVEESGVYDLEWGAFNVGMFSLEVVDGGFGKNSEVGYQVREGTYKLHCGGKIIGYFNV